MNEKEFHLLTEFEVRLSSFHSLPCKEWKGYGLIFFTLAVSAFLICFNVLLNYIILMRIQDNGAVNL